MTELERIRQEFAARMLAQGGQQPAPKMSPVPNQQGQMSPENMALLRGQAAYDPGKRESILADQLRGGRDQVFAAGPQGKQMGNIFTAPTWSENLSGAVKKGLGGLEMARARKGMTEVDDLRGVAADATGQLGQIAEDERLTQQMTANDAVTARQGLAQSVHEANVANDAAQLADDVAAREAKAQEAKEAEKVRLAERLEDYEREAEKGRLDRAGREEVARIKAQLGGQEPIGSNKNMTEEQTSAINALKTGGERGDARTYINSIKRIDGLAAKAEQMLEDGSDWTSFSKTAAAEIAGKVPFIGDSARGAMKDAVYDEPQQAMRQDVLSSYTEFRRSLTGANLTAMEQFIEEDGDPLQDGISSKQSYERLKKLKNHMAGRLETMGVPLPSSKPRSEPRPEDPDDIPTVDLSTKPIEDMTDEELQAYLNG